MNIILPNRQGTSEQLEVQEQSIVIIGANGSGKSRLGAWIEKQNSNKVHRISAQRSLVIPDYIALKSYEQAEDDLIFGNWQNKNKEGYRWNWGKYTTSLLNDYDKVLSALFAQKSKINEEYVDECREKEKNGQPKGTVPESNVDRIIKIWEDVFPHRKLILKDAKVSVEFNGNIYNGSEMSDGERVALYLMAQALCALSNSIIIIDEPEVHLHKSIMNILWSKLEEYRKDCLFIYITHDIQFASGHKNSRKLRVHEYLGNNTWNYEFVDGNDDVPEELLLEILGTRKNVIFIEGKRESLDYSLYQHFYSDYSVIPCESCIKVIESTKSLRNHNQLHHLRVFGLIDRDYRTEKEVEALKEDGIYVLDIAEVENLFIIEEIYNVVAEQLMRDKNDVEEAKKFVINLFESCLDTQIKNAVVSEIKYKLTIYDVNKNDEEKINEAINDISQWIKVNELFSVKAQQFNRLKEERNYANILKYFNYKGLYKSIGRFLGIQNSEYSDLVIRLLHSDKKSEIIKGLEGYLPNII
ncbi:MAG: DUF4435 domain-containing protein [Clostridium sp.]|nr:DUF4435 domain-containing protein [Clostridium sp.]